MSIIMKFLYQELKLPCDYQAPLHDGQRNASALTHFNRKLKSTVFSTLQTKQRPIGGVNKLFNRLKKKPLPPISTTDCKTIDNRKRAKNERFAVS